MMNGERSVVDACQRISVVMRPREKTISQVALGVPHPFPLHNLRLFVRQYLVQESHFCLKLPKLCKTERLFGTIIDYK